MSKTNKRFVSPEKFLKKSCLFFLTLLIMVQLLFLIPTWATRLNFALSLEGKPLSAVEQAGDIALLPWANITLQILDYPSRPEVTIILNGQEIGNFLQREFSFAVKKGDQIMINNPSHDVPVKVKVDKKTPNIRLPNLETSIEGTGKIYFSTIMLK